MIYLVHMITNHAVKLMWSTQAFYYQSQIYPPKGQKTIMFN